MNPAPLLPPPPSGACVLEVRAVRKGHQTAEVGVVALHALDVTTGITVLGAIERINRELGTLTVIITHNAVMAEMADRVLVPFGRKNRQGAAQ